MKRWILDLGSEIRDRDDKNCPDPRSGINILDLQHCREHVLFNNSVTKMHFLVAEKTKHITKPEREFYSVCVG
jgi:hypothetical protein